MSINVIYEKQYPNVDPSIGFDKEKIPDKIKKRTPPLHELVKNIRANTTYIIIPERIKASEKFIQYAIKISEIYRLDTKIKRHLNRINVTYSFDNCAGLRYINKIFGMVDQFAFFKNCFGRDITISLDFYTHATLLNGKVIAP